MDYDDYQILRLPTFLANEAGKLWAQVHGIFKEGVKRAAMEAVKARFASTAPLDALYPLLEESQLEPGFGASGDSMRARIRKRFGIHQKDGTKTGMEDALRNLGYTNFYVVEQWDVPNTNGWQWFEFEIVLYPPFPWPSGSDLQDGLWGDPGTWGDGGVWAASIPADHLAALRATLSSKRQKPTHARCRQIVIVHSGETWDFPPGELYEPTSEVWDGFASYLNP